MTTSNYNPGSRFSITHLTDHGIEEVDTPAIAAVIVARFDELATEAGDPTMSWIPETSEVYYECLMDPAGAPVYELTRPLDEIRDQAALEIWAMVEDGHFAE